MRSLQVFGLAILLGAGGLWAADLPDFPSQESSPGSLFDSIAALPGPALRYAELSDRPSAPDLVGEEALAKARGYDDLRVVVPDPKSAGRAGLVSRPYLFSGLDEKALFMGGFLSLAGATGLDKAFGGFFGSSFGAEYSRGTGSHGMEVAGQGSLGLYGIAPLPWTLGVRFGTDADFNLTSEAGLDVGGMVRKFPKDVALSAFAGAGLRVVSTGAEFGSPDWYGHGLIELGHYDHVGAFSRGWGAWSAAGVEGAFDGSGLAQDLRVGLDAAFQFRELVGVEARGSASYANEEKSDWASRLRGLSNATSIVGDQSVLLSVDLPLLFARGRLFRNDDLAVEFTLSPWMDGGLIRAPGSDLFDGPNIHAGAGGDLTMSLDRYRRDSLVVSVGKDVSGPLGGNSTSDAVTTVSASLFLEL